MRDLDCLGGLSVKRDQSMRFLYCLVTWKVSSRKVPFGLVGFISEP
jgi:hypothetical protein